MKSNSAILMICLAAIAVSFATPKGSTRQSARIKDTTGIATSVSVRSRFVGTWELVSTEYRYADGNGRVGIIASVTRPFCLNCNRLRLTADGKLRYCLFAIDETDVRGLLRDGAPDEDIERTIRENVRAKWLGHEINSSSFVPPPRPMYSIGG